MHLNSRMEPLLLALHSEDLKMTPFIILFGVTERSAEARAKARYEATASKLW